MKKLNKEQMVNISGGSSYVSSTLLSSISRLGTFLFELGRSLGSSIRRIYDNDTCSL